jgi:hypothetical protein
MIEVVGQDFQPSTEAACRFTFETTKAEVTVLLGIVEEHSGSIRGTHSGNIRAISGQHFGNIRATSGGFRGHSGSIDVNILRR